MSHAHLHDYIINEKKEEEGSSRVHKTKDVEFIKSKGSSGIGTTGFVVGVLGDCS